MAYWSQHESLYWRKFWIVESFALKNAWRYGQINSWSIISKAKNAKMKNWEGTWREAKDSLIASKKINKMNSKKEETKKEA